MESLATFRAPITPLTKMQIGLSAQRYVLYDLRSVIVYDARGRATTGADVLLPGQFKVNMNLVIEIFYVSNNYIFQIEQFCGIILVGHSDLPFLVW
jgi:hypothetical protein